jgi:hypothetical protein
MPVVSEPLRPPTMIELTERQDHAIEVGAPGGGALVTVFD